jgi:cytochrome c biogenesis protein CcmG, thiol:disulfide interchange protein DsbE
VRGPLLGLAALALALTACEQGMGERPRGIVAVGAPAPPYAARLLDGTPVSLEEHRGEVVLLNIWATWCKPCREEIPALETLYQQHRGDGFLVAGVSIDQPGETERIESFAAALGATYPLWHDPDDKVSTMFLSIGVPASYLIDRQGILRWRHVGPVTADDTALGAALATALASEGERTAEAERP